MLAGNVANADRLPQRIGGLKQLFDDRLPDHADLRGGMDVAIREEHTAAELPVADGEVIHVAAVDFLGAPIGVPADDLSRRAHDRRGRQHGGAFGTDGPAVRGGQRVDHSLPHTPALMTARQHDDHIRAQHLELALHESAGTLADRDHGGHGGNADDDAEDRQAGAHLVLHKCPPGHAKCQHYVHPELTSWARCP